MIKQDIDILIAQSTITELPQNPPLAEVERRLRMFAELFERADELQWNMARSAAIDALRNAGVSCPARLVDAARKSHRDWPRRKPIGLTAEQFARSGPSGFFKRRE